MKRALVIFIAVMTCSLSSCGAEIADFNSDIGRTTCDGQFVVVKGGLANSAIVYDIDTNVMYIRSWSYGGGSAYELLVNADGTPRIYENEEEDK